MSSTTETKKEGFFGGPKRGPPTEEERQQHEAEFKQEFLDEYRKRYGDSLISAEQTWELYQAIQERWHAKMKERHHERHPHHEQDNSPHRHGHSPAHFEEKRKQFQSELRKDFENDFTAAHGTNKVNSEQAWLLIQKVKHNKHEKWQANRQKNGHEQGDHGQHSPPRHQ